MLLSQRNERDSKSCSASTRDHRNHPFIRPTPTALEANVNRSQAHSSNDDDQDDFDPTDFLRDFDSPHTRARQQTRSDMISQPGADGSMITSERSVTVTERTSVTPASR